MKFFLEWASALWLVVKFAGLVVAFALAAKYASASGDAYFFAFLALAFTALIAWERSSAPKYSIKGSHE